MPRGPPLRLRDGLRSRSGRMTTPSATGGDGNGTSRSAPADCAAVIVDAHNDLLLELVLRRDDEEQPLELVLRRGEERLFERYWLPRLVAGGVGVQVCPLYAADSPREEARGRALAQAAEFARAVEENAERVCQVGTRAELDDPRLRLVLSMEGVEPLEGDPGAFEEWYELGVRSASLTWNYANEFAGGIETPTQGLTDRGKTARPPLRRARRRPRPRARLRADLARRARGRGALLGHARGLPRGVRPSTESRRLAARGARRARRRARDDGTGVRRRSRGADPSPLARPFRPRGRRDGRRARRARRGLRRSGRGCREGARRRRAAAPPERRRSRQARPASGSRASRGRTTTPRSSPRSKARGYDGERLDAILNGNWLRVLGESLPA